MDRSLARNQLPMTKPAPKYGSCLVVYTDSPSRLEVPEAAVKLAKTILRRDAKLTRTEHPEMGTAHLVEGEIFQAPEAWKESDARTWKRFALPLAWWATTTPVPKKKVAGPYL